MALLRLNYAVELRYGVPVEIAQKILAGGEIDVTNGFFNCIWQRDANDMILRSFALTASPAEAWNLTGMETLSVRDVAARFAEIFQKPLKITGAEASNALLSNSIKLRARLGAPKTSLEEMVQEIAHWLQNGGRLLNKPTRFEVRDGTF
jgi:nucleoside-diphosphate-sugar epimerase